MKLGAASWEGMPEYRLERECTWMHWVRWESRDHTTLPGNSPQRGLLHMRRAGIPVEGHQDAGLGQQLCGHKARERAAGHPLLCCRDVPDTAGWSRRRPRTCMRCACRRPTPPPWARGWLLCTPSRASPAPSRPPVARTRRRLCRLRHAEGGGRQAAARIGAVTHNNSEACCWDALSQATPPQPGSGQSQ